YLMHPPPHRSTLFPYTTLFRSIEEPENLDVPQGPYLRNSRKLGTFSFANVPLLDPLSRPQLDVQLVGAAVQLNWTTVAQAEAYRSEEHTSELQSRENLVCRLLL